MSIDLTQYFPEEVALDLKKNLVLKVIIGTKAKDKRKLRDCMLSLQTDMFLDDTVGFDWFDYAFVDHSTSKINITFYRVMPDKSKKKITVTVDEHDAMSRDTKNILGVIRSARSKVGGGWV